MANLIWVISLLAVALLLSITNGDELSDGGIQPVSLMEEDFDVSGENQGNESVEIQPAARTIVGEKSNPCVPNTCPPDTYCTDKNGRRDCISTIVKQSCSPNPCMNGGLCSPSGVSHFCTCPATYIGPRCETYNSPSLCNINPCLNGGVCAPSGSSYTCACSSAYIGSHCETKMVINPCPLGHCLNGGTCQPSGTASICLCATSYTGPRCGTYTPHDPCAFNLCLNGGVCHPSGSVHYCTCPSTYVGSKCETYVPPNPCTQNPCMNGGTCRPSGFTSICFCATSYTGSRCATYTPPNPCAANPCLNGGTCHHSGSAQYCTCLSSFGGSKCETYAPPNPCAQNPCMNGGTCQQTGSTYTCLCATSYAGPLCDTYNPPNPCAVNPCLNGGVCHPSGSIHYCTCRSSYVGSKCETYLPPSQCAQNPCMNGGACQSSGSSYTCACLSNYGGSRCEIYNAPNPCGTNPCLNGGTCHATGLSYTCACLTSYSGQRCEIYSAPNPCANNPCLNQGFCQPSGSSYSCSCINQYTGAHCEHSPATKTTTACTGISPCKNNCECVPSCRHSSGYYCRSADGYLGKDCTVPPPQVVCGPSQITVTVDDAFLREYDLGIGNSRLNLAHSANDHAAQNCFALTTAGISHMLSIALPFEGKCGTTVNAVGENTVVTNNIWLNRQTNGAYDMPVPVICFECTYTKEYRIVTSLSPAVHTPEIIRSKGSTQLNGMIELCKVSTSCPQTCPAQFGLTQGAVYTVGEMIHLNIRGEQNSPETVALRDLSLSCDGNVGSAGIVQLVSNGCPGGTLNYMKTMITHSAISSSVCVSFQVPRLQRCQVFYIHASLERCQTACTYNSGNCQIQGRRRRSSSTDSLDDIYGPIYIIDGVQGVAHNILFPNTSIVDTPAVILDMDVPFSDHNEELQSTWMIVGISVLCLFIILSISFAMFYYRHRTSFPRKKYLSTFSSFILKFR